MKRILLQKAIFLPTFLFLLIFLTGCSKDEDNGPVNFSLSKTSTLAFDVVFIEFDSSGEVNFFIDTPDSFQYEFSKFNGSRIDEYLVYPGTYRITQLGHNENYQEIEVYPNHIFWSDFQGDTIDVTIEESTFQEELNGSVNCVTPIAPSCSEYQDYSCAYFGIKVGFGATNTQYYATDGTYTWTGFIGTIQGECYEILLSTSNAD